MITKDILFIMKFILRVGVILLLIVFQAKAQKADVIRKTDGTELRVYFATVKNKIISFRLKPTAKGPINSIPTSLVTYVHYSSGKKQIYMMEKIPVKTLVLPVEIEANTSLNQLRSFKYYIILTKPAEKSSVPIRKNAIPESEQFRPSSERYPKTRTLSVYAGVDVVKVMGNRQWTDESEGMGLSTGSAGSVSADLRLADWISLTTKVGVVQWKIQRNFRDSLFQDLIFTRNSRVDLFPIQLGVKIYTFKGFYISPQVITQLYYEKREDKDAYNEIGDSFSYKAIKTGYSGEIGYEYRLKRLRFVLGALYTSVLVKKVGDFSRIPALNYSGVRFAVGVNI